MSRQKLPPGEAERRNKARSKHFAVLKKSKRDADRISGIKPVKVDLSEETKLRMRLYSQKIRAERRALNPPRIKVEKTDEERREYHRQKSRNYSRKKNKTKPENFRFGAEKKVTVKPTKPVKMQQSIKRTPQEQKEIKKPKPDMFKQEKVVVVKSNDEGKIKVRLNQRTEVMASPGYDIEALRRKYGIV